MKHQKYTGLMLSMASIALTSGCVSTGKLIVTEPVGPASLPTEIALPSSPRGYLKLFTEFETNMVSVTDLDDNTRHYSDYEIHRVDGSVLTRVKNRVSQIDENPARISLPPGEYTVIAKAERLGWITIPILIVDQKNTIIHLESTPPRDSEHPLAEFDLIKSTSGRVVGWRSLY